MIYRRIKRMLDMILSIIGILILSPILIITAVLIYIDSRGPIIFKQKRLGLNGKEFYMYKFRSMCCNAENKGSGHYSFKGDPRVTRVGKIIRATSIDELPQFFNIIKGDMSLIGPRPTLTYHPYKYKDYSKEQLKRFNVRPGVTGLAQINGRKDITWSRRIKYDIEYVDNFSFRMDLKILMITILKVITMRDNVNVNITIEEKGKEADERWL
ncbi:sugar transferase [Fusobacterium sp. MFO224]|uniref:sugar transferase n=1 Tax=Fusobacterium sp. MFO224 TaxID=3378070 RepID=UPI00385407B0